MQPFIFQSFIYIFQKARAEFFHNLKTTTNNIFRNIGMNEVYFIFYPVYPNILLFFLQNLFKIKTTKRF